MSTREFAAGWSAAMKFMDPANLLGLDENARAAFEEVDRVLADRREADERMRRLDAAERAGDAAYAVERARQGLVPYDRHRGLVVGPVT